MAETGDRSWALRLAHRGDWRVAPENSLAAMRAALANPACDGLEFDVRASRDGVPILLHDDTLARVQGRPERPDELSVEDLAAAGIPTLAEVLAAVGPEPFLDVELKGEPIPAVIDVLEAARGPGLLRTVVSSFEVPTLVWVGTHRPRWRRWLNAMDLERGTLRLTGELACQAVSVDWHAIDDEGIARARSEGVEVAAWTVRARSNASKLERLGVIAVCVEGRALDGR
ncbi:MAG: glycerophosphodiester phosphodiesterase [Chloroflexota bacterium]|nr:MAG: glycerophosphodiester phosphodiesterase [Chloroflexota bacterium]